MRKLLFTRYHIRTHHAHKLLNGIQIQTMIHNQTVCRVVSFNENIKMNEKWKWKWKELNNTVNSNNSSRFSNSVSNNNNNNISVINLVYIFISIKIIEIATIMTILCEICDICNTVSNIKYMANLSLILLMTNGIKRIEKTNDNDNENINMDMNLNRNYNLVKHATFMNNYEREKRQIMDKLCIVMHSCMSSLSCLISIFCFFFFLILLCFCLVFIVLFLNNAHGLKKNKINIKQSQPT